MTRIASIAPPVVAPPVAPMSEPCYGVVGLFAPQPIMSTLGTVNGSGQLLEKSARKVRNVTALTDEKVGLTSAFGTQTDVKAYESGDCRILKFRCRRFLQLCSGDVLFEEASLSFLFSH